MKKNFVFISSCVVFLFSLLNATAQTTELVYNLGVAANPVTINSIVTDASDNIFICGTYKGASVNFNPLGTAVTKSSVSSSQDGFIAKYNSSGILQKVNSFGTASAVDKATKLVLDNSGNVYMSAVIFGSTFFELGTGPFVAGGSGATVLVKYDNTLAVQSARNIRTSTGGAGDEILDLKVDGSGNIYLTGTLRMPIWILNGLPPLLHF